MIETRALGVNITNCHALSFIVTTGGYCKNYIKCYENLELHFVITIELTMQSFVSILSRVNDRRTAISIKLT